MEGAVDIDKVPLRFKTIIELVGKPKEHIEKTLKQYVEKIKATEDIVFISENYAETKEEEKMFSTYVELELIVKGFSNLIGFCIDYMPASIDISKPEELYLKNNNVTRFFNDLMVRLHNLDLIVKNVNAENNFLKKNFNAVIVNLVTISLKLGPLDLEKLSKATGIPEKELQAYLDSMVKEEKIKKENDEYSLV